MFDVEGMKEMYKPTTKRWIFSTLGAGALCPLLSPAFLFLVLFQSVYAVFQGGEGVGMYLAGGIMFAFIAGLIPGIGGTALLAVIARLKWSFFDGAKKRYWSLLGGSIGLIFSALFILTDLEMMDMHQAFLITANNVLTGAVAAYLFRFFLFRNKNHLVASD